MPSSIELNIGHVPSPRRTRGAQDDDDGDRDDFDFVVQGLAGGVLRLKDVDEGDTLEFRKSKQQPAH